MDTLNTLNTLNVIDAQQAFEQEARSFRDAQPNPESVTPLQLHAQLLTTHGSAPPLPTLQQWLVDWSTRKDALARQLATEQLDNLDQYLTEGAQLRQLEATVFSQTAELLLKVVQKMVTGGGEITTNSQHQPYMHIPALEIETASPALLRQLTNDIARLTTHSRQLVGLQQDEQRSTTSKDEGILDNLSDKALLTELQRQQQQQQQQQQQDTDTTPPATDTTPPATDTTPPATDTNP